MPRRSADDWLVKDVVDGKRQRVSVADGSVTAAVRRGGTTIRYPPDLREATAQALECPGAGVLYELGKPKMFAMWRKYGGKQQPPIDSPENPQYVVVYWDQPSESDRPDLGNPYVGQRVAAGWYVGRLQGERKLAGTTEVAFKNGKSFDLVDVELVAARYRRDSGCKAPAAGAWCYLY